MDTFVLDLLILGSKVKDCLIIEIYFLLTIMRRMIKYTKIFSVTEKIKKVYCVICGKYRKFEKCRISYLLEKTPVLSIIYSAKMKMKNYLKKKNQLRYKKILV